MGLNPVLFHIINTVTGIDMLIITNTIMGMATTIQKITKTLALLFELLE